MKGKDTSSVRAQLMLRGHSFASIAAELGVCRQHVRDVVAGIATSERVSKAIAAKLRRVQSAA